MPEKIRASADRLAHHNRSCSECPRAVLVISDPIDSAVSSDIKTHDSRQFPRAVSGMEKKNGRLAVHFAHGEPPHYLHARVNAKIAAGGEAACVTIGHLQAGVGADQFTQPIPIAAIES